MKKNWFTIIIPNYNGEEYLDICLSSILKSKYKKYKILIADDNSTDKSIEIVKKYQRKSKNIQILKSNKNLGPSGQRAKALKKIETEYIYFLDNDTEVDKDFLTNIYKVYQQNPSVAGVQSMLVDFDDRKKIQNEGLKLIPYTGWAIGIKQNKNINLKSKSPQPVLGLSAALSVKTEVIRSGITFDPDFVHYSEDLDFTWRMWVAGFDIYSAPDSIVYHKVKKIDERKNVGANNEVVYFHLSKNSLTSITKNYNSQNLIKYLPICLFILLARAVLVLLVRLDSSSFVGTTKAIKWYVTNLPNTIKKRQHIQKNLRKYSDEYILKNIALNESILNVYKNYFSQTKLLPV